MLAQSFLALWTFTAAASAAASAAAYGGSRSCQSLADKLNDYNSNKDCDEFYECERGLRKPALEQCPLGLFWNAGILSIWSLF